MNIHRTLDERVGKYMIRPLLSLERLSLDERTGQVRYRYGKEPKIAYQEVLMAAEPGGDYFS